MKYVINIDEDNPIHADDRETVYMDKDTGMTWTISNNGKKKMIPLERIGNDMSDLIDRQAAIDFLSKWITYNDDGEQILEVNPDTVFHGIEALPSAQPTLYGYKIEHLAYIARVMEKEGVTADYAVRTFDDMSRVIKMIIEEIQQKVEETLNDTISRQSAIDIASGYCHPANIAKELEKLPSAQPEIIRCKDCKYWMPHSQLGFDEDNGVYHDYCQRLVPEDEYYAFYRGADDFCSRAERR